MLFFRQKHLPESLLRQNSLQKKRKLPVLLLTRSYKVQCFQNFPDFSLILQGTAKNIHSKHPNSWQADKSKPRDAMSVARRKSACPGEQPHETASRRPKENQHTKTQGRHSYNLFWTYSMVNLIFLICHNVYHILPIE